MSEYVRTKVVRYKPTEHNLKELHNDLWSLTRNYPELFDYYPCKTCGFFQIAPTEENYVDFVLNQSEGDGEFGRVRKLYPSETVKYGKIFQQLFKETEVALYNLKLVDYCFYNATEAPDYFDETKDEFFTEV